MMGNDQIEEALEILWTLLEEKSTSEMTTEEVVGRRLGISLDRLIEEGLVEKAGNTIRFTASGEREAEQTIRRHRLSERLFHDIIETDQELMETAACQVEHIVKRGIEEKICALLGHPETCPHGKPIPPGRCCRKARETREKFVVPLTRLELGESGVIAYIRAGDSRKLQKLMVMGVLPGNAVTLDQAFPSFVFTVGYSQYAVDADMAGVIFVRRTLPEEPVTGTRNMGTK